MFKFLKDKLKSAVSKFSKQVDEEAIPIEEPQEIKPAKKIVQPEEPEEPKVIKPAKKIVQPEEPKKRGFFGKLFGKKEDLFEEIEKDAEEFEDENKVKYEPAEEKKADEELQEKIKEIEEEPASSKEDYEDDKEMAEEEIIDEFIEEKEQKEEEVEETKKGFFGKIKEGITKKAISKEKFNEIFWELEVTLMESNVAVEVIEKIKEDLKKELVDKKVLRGKIEEIIISTLKKSIEELLSVEGFNLVKTIKAKGDKPYVIVFVGINGTGKTTTIAKIVKLLQNNNISSVIAAADTFRAAAIQQLEEHAEKLGVKLIKHDYGSDPAAVAFDTIKYAKSKGIDCVLIDTAGRLHSNTNLMDEMKKIIRVAQPDLKIFVGDSLTGNDCVEQSREFNAAIGIDAIILAKADVDEKGGAALSVSYITKKPIIYFGMGQTYDSLEEFTPKKIIERLGLAV